MSSDLMPMPESLQSVIDKPTEYSNEWWRQIFQRHEADIHFLKGELNECKRLMKLAIETFNASASNRRQDAAKIGEVCSDLEVLTKRVDNASKVIHGMRTGKQENVITSVEGKVGAA